MRGVDCIKTSVESLREHVINTINFEKKKIILLTIEQQEWHERKMSAACSKYNLNINTLMIKIILKLKTVVIIQINTEVVHIAYVI